MKRLQSFWHPAYLTGIAYGFGLLLGNVISRILFLVFPSEIFLIGSPVMRLVLGILLAFLISGIGGLMGGFIGGYTLPSVGIGKGRWGYAWRSGITFGVGYGLLLFPVVLIVALLSFYDVAETPIFVFGLIFGFVGLLFGLLMGSSLGAWTVGRRFAPITRYSVLGFTAGGVMLGATLWYYLFDLRTSNLANGRWPVVLAGLFLFGGLGGLSLGTAYYRMADRIDKAITPIRPLTRSKWRRRRVIWGVLIVVILLWLRPILSAVGDLLTPIDASLSPVLDLATNGTHWLDGVPVTAVANEPDVQLAIAAGGINSLGLAWSTGESVMVQSGLWEAEVRQTTWLEAVSVAQMTGAAQPQVAVGDDGRLHLAWVAAGDLFVTQCAAAGCAAPTAVTAGAACAGLGAENNAPTLSLVDDSLLLVWQNNGRLPYISWPVDDAVPTSAAGCVVQTGTAGSPRLAANHLAYADDRTIQLTHWDGGEWAAAEALGQGGWPNLTLDDRQRPLVVWCTAGQLVFWQEGAAPESLDIFCQSRPEVAVDEWGQVHLLWYGSTVTNASGVVRPASVLYETMRTDGGWTPPAIAQANVPAGQPVLTAAEDGSLHMAWLGMDTAVYAAQVQYQCDPADLSPLGQEIYAVARQERYSSADSPIPFCDNQYEQLVYSPNPEPAFSDQLPYPNGVFDVMGDYIRSARYEVLYSTMWYDDAANDDSPGRVVADAVADLYAQVQANPEQYPRGMTVRIMLGNPPELITGETTGQLWTLIDDLREAGIDQMEDETIGWRLEVADFEGNLPHSHVKLLAVDGALVSANGFNMTYDHYPQDHVSGLGGGRFDLGVVVRGPVAQSAQRIFDDMWAGADQRHCLTLDPPLLIPWQVTCYDVTAVADHVPEVQKFTVTTSDDVAFSLYRSNVHDAADQQTITAVANAQESLDIVHVQFSLDMICSLNILFDVCTTDMAPDYVDAIIQAVQNGAKVRILVKPGPFEGIENDVAMVQLRERLAELGLQDQLELRYYPGSIHTKSVLVDEALLIIGSQNLHYSAYGQDTGLTEYNLAVQDEQAIADYQALFDFVWGISTAP
jgi:hypothetical protein